MAPASSSGVTFSVPRTREQESRSGEVIPMRLATRIALAVPTRTISWA
jgi:hypothetical protein